jgi:hypothetical protein
MKKKSICRRWIDENEHACERGAANRQQSNEDTTVNISRASW